MEYWTVLLLCFYYNYYPDQKEDQSAKETEATAAKDGK